MTKRYTIRVTFENFETLVTEINGTPDSICDYYIGNHFNIGQGGNDNMQRAVSVEFSDGEYFMMHKRSIIGRNGLPLNNEARP